jgi:hypothetical protein
MGVGKSATAALEPLAALFLINFSRKAMGTNGG